MLVTGKREWLARTIARSCHWLSKRSVRFQLLFEDIGGSLFLNDKMRLPAADPRYDAADLARRTDTFNVAAEDYFVRGEDRDFLLGKPFTDRLHFARRLFDLGVLFHWLRLTPDEVVLEIGAGSCWLSHLLNRFGCKTLAVDVSATALEIGRELFESDPRTNWTVGPEFIVYDGHRLPLEDDSVDKVVIYDAFHHIPNWAAVLREVARVLRDGGIVGMREPGRRHAAAEKSLAEVREFGVLENDVVVEDIERLGRRCGLDRTTVVPLTLDASIEIPASELAEFMRGKHLHAYWEGLCTAMVDGTFVLMYKGEALPDTRRPRRLAARIEPQTQAEPVAVHVGETLHLDVEVENTGDTLWLADIPRSAGVDPPRRSAPRCGRDVDAHRRRVASGGATARRGSRRCGHHRSRAAADRQAGQLPDGVRPRGRRRRLVRRCRLPDGGATTAGRVDRVLTQRGEISHVNRPVLSAVRPLAHPPALVASGVRLSP